MLYETQNFAEHNANAHIILIADVYSNYSNYSYSN